MRPSCRRSDYVLILLLWSACKLECKLECGDLLWVFWMLNQTCSPLLWPFKQNTHSTKAHTLYVLDGRRLYASAGTVCRYSTGVSTQQIAQPFYSTLLSSHHFISSSFLLIHSMLFLTVSSPCCRGISPAPASWVLLKKCSIYKTSMEESVTRSI